MPAVVHHQGTKTPSKTNRQEMPHRRKTRNATRDPKRREHENASNIQHFAGKRSVEIQIRKEANTAFINKVAAPIANKMFECGLIP